MWKLEWNHLDQMKRVVFRITPTGVSRLMVRLGDHDLSNKGETRHPPLDVKVKKVVRHRKFSFDLLVSLG